METLPNELILLIFDNITLITDKRQFLKTCMKYNKLTKYNFLQFENNYSIPNFNKINNHCVEKFTLELCHDRYFNMIPDYYITETNPIIAKALASFNCKKLLEIAKNKKCNIHGICSFAAFNGHLKVLKWAKANGRFDRTFICEYAALNGHLNVLKWAAYENCYWGNQVFTNAAHNGHLDCIMFACNYVKPRNKQLIGAIAARNGHLNIVKWAYNNGCIWDKNISDNAKQNGHNDILQWAIEKGFHNFNL